MCANKKKSDNITDSANKVQSHLEIASWQRVGLGNAITEKECVVNENTQGVRLHPSVTVLMDLDLEGAEKDAKTVRTQRVRRGISLTGPYEVKGINPKAIHKVFPPDKNMNFEYNHLPYVEFAEADLPWRYTPALHNENKLTPWVSLIACKTDEFMLTRNKEGMQIVTIKGEPEIWSNVFGDAYQNASHLWAHVQKMPKKSFSRVLCPRQLEEYTAYALFLIPTYEVGRLSGLGIRLPEQPKESVKPIEQETPFDIPVQTRSWAVEADKQKKRVRGFEFPVYYSWRFQTSTGDFHTLARKLEAITTTGLPKDVKVEVSKMGIGLDYELLENPPKDKSVGIAMASMPLTYYQEDFPKSSSVLAGRMQDLLSKSHVFDENKDLLTSINGEESNANNEDPWVVPPVYGAKHVLTTSLEKSKSAHPWLYELNTQVPNRIAAGLGMEVIKQNQEKLVQRVWEQVGEVMEINQKIREKFLGISTSKDLYYNKVNNLSNLRREELRKN